MKRYKVLDWRWVAESFVELLFIRESDALLLGRPHWFLAACCRFLNAASATKEESFLNTSVGDYCIMYCNKEETNFRLVVNNKVYLIYLIESCSWHKMIITKKSVKTRFCNDHVSVVRVIQCDKSATIDCISGACMNFILKVCMHDHLTILLRRLPMPIRGVLQQ